MLSTTHRRILRHRLHSRFQDLERVRCHTKEKRENGISRKQKWNQSRSEIPKLRRYRDRHSLLPAVSPIRGEKKLNRVAQEMHTFRRVRRAKALQKIQHAAQKPLSRQRAR